jgi:hypothetical protein
MRRGSRGQPFSGVPLFPARLSSHLQRLGLGTIQAARQIGCSPVAVRDALMGGGVATDELAVLYSWVTAEDRLHPHESSSDRSSD